MDGEPPAPDVLLGAGISDQLLGQGRGLAAGEIIGRLGDAGFALVPLSLPLYFQDGWVKVEIVLARGRRSFVKRQAIAQRDGDREIARELSDRLRGRRRRPRGPG